MVNYFPLLCDIPELEYNDRLAGSIGIKPFGRITTPRKKPESATKIVRQNVPTAQQRKHRMVK